MSRKKESAFRAAAPSWLFPHPVQPPKISLDHLCSPPRNWWEDDPPPRINAATFREISRLLQANSKSLLLPDGGSKRPRLYTILRNMGELHLLYAFVRSGLTDFDLPFTQEGLCKYIEDEDLRALFLFHQRYVLTATRALDLGGPHIFLDEGAEFHFDHVRELGYGKYGPVDHVVSYLSLRRYARKCFSRGPDSEQTRKHEHDFIVQIKALKALSHRHLVQYIGSYTDEKHIAFLMKPVADWNLRSYLHFVKEVGGKEKLASLRYFFGCLAGAIGYLHENAMEHRAIKSSNILVLEDRVFISDFGGLVGATLSGSPLAHSGAAVPPLYYMAPEVAQRGASTTASDMWSLGVVFLEIATTLLGRSLSVLAKFIEVSAQNNGLKPYPWDDIDSIYAWIEKIDNSRMHEPGSGHDAESLVWTRSLLRHNPEQRLTAAQLMERIVQCWSFRSFCCLECLPQYENIYTDQQESVETQPGEHTVKETVKNACRPTLLEGVAALDLTLEDLKEQQTLDIPMIFDPKVRLGLYRNSQPIKDPESLVFLDPTLNTGDGLWGPRGTLSTSKVDMADLGNKSEERTPQKYPQGAPSLVSGSSEHGAQILSVPLHTSKKESLEEDENNQFNEADRNSPTYVVAQDANELGDQLEGSVTTESNYRSDQIFSNANISSQDTGSVLMPEGDDTQTVYSDAMTVATSTKETYVTELAEQLLLAVAPYESSDETIDRISKLLPEYLRAFALRFGSKTVSQAQRDIMVFVHKYRQNITETFTNRYSKERAAQQGNSQHDGMSLDEIMGMWYRSDRGSTGEGIEERTTAHGDMDPWKGDSRAVANEDGAENDNDHNDTTSKDHINTKGYQGETTTTDGDGLRMRLPELENYRECILAAPAYQWLLTDLRRQCLLMPSMPDLTADIGKTILQSLPSPHRFSRRESPSLYKMTYRLQWDPLAFVGDQEYREAAPDSLTAAITLTGCASTAQALTCSQYLYQTWPCSAQHLLDLIRVVLRSPPMKRAWSHLADGTTITASIHPSEIAERTLFCVGVIGTAYSVVEVGEQLAWIGASLRSSPYPDGVAYSQPIVRTLRVIRDDSASPMRVYVGEVTCDFSFVLTCGDKPRPESNGQCWQNLFRNPVMVMGYPIARRFHANAVNGLEIPLYMMARLARTQYVNKFAGKTVIKGFSTMLVPTQQYGNTIVWHLLHDPHGDRVSYLESLENSTDEIPIHQWRGTRHVLGWCLEAKFLAGTVDAKYDVTRSRLPRTGVDCLLQHSSVSSGQMITGGPPFSIGYKDSPFHVSRSGYIRKLKWISRKFVVLWDEEAKQGWLVNGTSALLHLVRSSLVHDSNDKFSSEFLFRQEYMQEAPRASYTSDAAIAVLLNSVNRKLRIYPDKDGYVLFEDRVEHVFNLLEQIIDHQINSAGHDGATYRSKNIPRAHLEGWDFHDLAIDGDPVYPRVAKLDTLGKAWVEFTRSIHAVTLLGRGFGEIIKPAEKACSQWATLPKDKYYMAASVADLMDIMESLGDATANPPRLTENLIWQNAHTAVTHCGCTESGDSEHIDVAQVILPPGIGDTSKAMGPQLSLGDGAVIFGYNQNIPWYWKDTGDPVRGEPERLDGTCLSPSLETGSGPSVSPSIEGESGSMRLLSAPFSPSSKTSVSIPSASLTARLSAKPRFPALTTNDYTVGIVCALALELLAVRALFDVTHTNSVGIISHEDSNHYALGEIGRHRVVAACLPEGEYGTNSAADVATNLRRTFPAVKFALLVGIGGGAPSPANDIRLGDVVVSRPTGTTTGVIQYDMGKSLENGIFTQQGVLHPPPRLIMTAVSNLKSDPHLSASPLQEHLDDITAYRREYKYPGKEHDRIFSSEYVHDPRRATCDSCDLSQASRRVDRPDNHPHIHYGVIASGNRVVRDAKLRDRWSQERGVLCFEMEAAGIMNTLPCVVIRGICDYSDSHKNKRFQEYAAATAASYAKLLLSYMKDLNDLGSVRSGLDSTKQSLPMHLLKKSLSFFRR